MKVQDLQTADQSLWAQYIQYFANGNYAAALNILNNTQLDTKKMVGSLFNSAADDMTVLQSAYTTNVTDTLAAHIVSFNQMIANLVAKQEYSASATYSKGNFVVYNGNVYVYIADNPASGIVPTNTSYWLYVGLRGDDGIDGVGLTLKYEWAGNTQYAANDVVIYKDVMYYAKTDNINNVPDTSTAQWEVLFTLPVAKIFTGSISPDSIERYTGLIWFKEEAALNYYINVNPDMSKDVEAIIEFESAGQNWNKFFVDYALGDMIYSNTETGASSGYVCYSGKWPKGEQYRFVYFKTPPTGDLLTWLQNNATIL